MNITQVVSDMLTGDPLKDSIIIGLAFSFFLTFWDIMFSSIFSLFKSQR